MNSLEKIDIRQSIQSFFRELKKTNFYVITHPWEYTLEMLIVPPSTVSSS